MKPATEAEVVECLAAASGPLRIVGGGTRGIGGTRGEVLETGGLAGISLYEPGALTLVAGAGTPLAEVEAVLARAGQRLAFEVPDFRALLGRRGVSTLGGVVAANASGPRRVQAGACRDALIGVRFVDGAGLVVKNGGRVMKNVTGLDLVKLMAGSWGTLGVLTEVAFKLLPVPEASVTLRLPGLDDARAVAALAAALGTPYEVTGAAHWPGQGTYLRLEGFSGSVDYRAGRLAEVLAGFGAAERVDGVARWQAIRDVTAFAGCAGDVWRLSVKPSDAPGLVARSGAQAVLYDWGGGLVWLLMPEGADLRAALGGFSGHATLVRAAAETHARLATFQPEAPPVAAITAALRARFDPRGILNPGLM
ncbi:FAD-binding protein [Rhodobacter ferrooxidans]|uniref:FAD linked oxidase domain protein n=1 Tax=Rhodobacter ferrooxidans TaxID=371731 RepID=C8S1N1_9RHOB|nr:FAD-binding protein [Rhodobacter sp. SW2]EEW25204.1 FAD linked oxidase domain protein [Rhodobacter sp. SW2]